MNGIGIVFNIDELGGGFYSSKAWRIFMHLLSPDTMTDCSVKEGDTQDTLAGSRREFCIAVFGPELDQSRVKMAFEKMLVKGLAPSDRRFIVSPQLDAEPLVAAGAIDSLGRLVQDEWSRSFHDRCKDCGWEYAPRSTPGDLPEDVKAELRAMRKAHTDPAIDPPSLSEFEMEREYPWPVVADGGRKYPQTQALREIARQLASQHGPLTEARCGTDQSSRIVFVFQDGTRIPLTEPNLQMDLSMCQFGYIGTGTSCFWAFLDESGFNIPFWYLTNTFSRREVLTRGMWIQPPRLLSSKALGVNPEECKQLLEDYLPPVAREVRWKLPEAMVASGKADSQEAALQKARTAIPRGAIIEQERISRPASKEQVVVPGFLEAEGKRKASLPEDAKILQVTQTRRPIQIGSWKIRAGEYSIKYTLPAEAIIKYRIRDEAVVNYEVSADHGFRFPCGYLAFTSTELLQHSREHVEEAIRHLQAGDYERFLCPRWSRLCTEVKQRESDPRRQVEAFIQAVTSDRQISEKR